MTADVNTIPIIDTHEHIENIYRWRAWDTGLLHILLENHYLMALVAAADPAYAGREWNDEREPIEPLAAVREADGRLSGDAYAKAMEWFIDRLPLVAHTSDWRAMRIAVRDLFGMPDFVITRQNWPGADRAVRECYRDREAWHGEVFKRANISTVFWCYGKPPVPGPFRSVVSLGDFLGGPREVMVESGDIERAFGKWLAGIIADLDIVSLKIGSAYRRDTAIAKRSPREVDAALAEMGEDAPLYSVPPVDDFVHDLAADACARRGIPVQVHTGYLAGNTFENPLHKTYAARMEGFFARHPGARFDVFHGSFPQWGEAVTLARHYPNVYLNMCWVPSTSESMAAAMLTAALDAVPINKIMWGGDAHSPEMAYGIAHIFRGIVDRAVAPLEGTRGMKREAAEWILWRTAADLYGLKSP